MNTSELLQLAERYETPFYVYDGNIIENQIYSIRKAFSKTSNLQVNYAMKALSTIGILKFIKARGCFVDTVSLNEVKLALVAGFDPSNIFYTPNGARFDEIKTVYTMGVHVTLDNLIQIEQIAKLNSKKAIAIRLNPNIDAGGNEKIKVAKKDSKFGLALENMNQLKEICQQYDLAIDGFHIHLGSDIINMTTFKLSAHVLFDIAINFKNLKFINFGGGFKVKYSEKDTFLDINKVGDILSNVFNDFEKKYGNELILVIEPGKFLVSNSGYFLTQVTTIKDHTVFVNSGFNHFIRPMYYDAYHNIKNLSRSTPSTKNYNIVGYVCEQDTFGKNRPLNTPHIHDIICMENAGAYCFTMASNYNARLRPLELLSYNGTTKIIRTKESFDDLLQNQIY